MKINKVLVSVVILFASYCGTAFASHTTTGNASYVGHLHDGTVFDEVTLTSGADWFNLYMVAGQQITVSVLRGDIGNLLPNISVFNGEADIGETIADAGLVEQFFPPGTSSNSSSSSQTLTFTPNVTDVWTLIVTTWTGQTGTYDISCTGCGNMPNAQVPEPSTIAIFAASLFSVLMLRRRKTLQIK